MSRTSTAARRDWNSQSDSIWVGNLGTAQALGDSLEPSVLAAAIDGDARMEASR
jgi:hypothetical protein